MKLPILLAAFSLIVSAAQGQTVPAIPKKAFNADERVVGHVHILEKLPPPPVGELKVPPGFKIERFAENLGHARLLAVGPGGRVYLTRRDQGDVLMFELNASGLPAGGPRRVASRTGMHGIAFHGDTVYLATIKEVFRAPVLADGSFGPLEMIIHDLPDGGQHPTRTIQVGPDQMLYIGVASATNDAMETNPEAATILRASLDGKSRVIFAAGLRDPIGWGWHPSTGELWAMDHGIDWLGDDEQPEELNRLEKGKRYGWPYFYGENQPNLARHPPGDITRDEMRRASVPMVAGYTAHASPMQLSFYNGGQFPAEFQGDAFVSMRGSWNRKPASGYEVVRIRFKDGRPQKFEPFVTGFVDRKGEYGRLCGNAVANDGSLLFTDDRNGIIYRVSYQGKNASGPATPAAIPSSAMEKQNEDGRREPLAQETLATAPLPKLAFSSPAFADNGAIPEIFSAYDQNASPPLQWSGAPSGTKSFVLVMEDPDAKNVPLPVVHWVAWNIPATVTSLREGLPPSEALDEPQGMRQGANYLGKPGYSGPRPPKGDAAHRYFVQIFAVDSKLDLLPGSTRKEVLAALRGHVLAVGVFHGNFRRPEHPTKP